jgi:hypothetical protein
MLLHSRDHIIVSLARHSGKQWMARAENKYPSYLNQNNGDKAGKVL